MILYLNANEYTKDQSEEKGSAVKALKELAALYAGIPAEFTPTAPQSDYQLSNEEIIDFISPDEEKDKKKTSIDEHEEEKGEGKDEEEKEEEGNLKTHKWKLIKQSTPFKKAVIVEKTFTSTGIDKETLQLILDSKDKQTKEFTDTIKFMIEQQTQERNQERAMREVENFQKMEMFEKVMNQYKDMFDKFSENLDKLSENEKQIIT